MRFGFQKKAGANKHSGFSKLGYSFSIFLGSWRVERATQWSLSVIFYHSSGHILRIESFSPEDIGCNGGAVA